MSKSRIVWLQKKLSIRHLSRCWKYLSGAGGGSDIKLEENKQQEEVYGFLKCNLLNDKLYSRFYYTTDKINWQTWDPPVCDLSEIQKFKYPPNSED